MGDRNRVLNLLVVILLAAFFLRQHKLLDFPFFGDELKNGDIALEILDGNIAPFYPHAYGREALYDYSMVVSFLLFGDSVLANRWPSVAWSMVFVALMYVYGRVMFDSRRVGVMAAGITAALWWPAVFAHIGVRPVTMPVMSVPALLGLVVALRASSDRRALWAGAVGGVFAGLTAYTYTAGRGFPVVVVLFLLYALVMQRQALFKRWPVFLLYLILMVAVSAWLYVYLHRHPEVDMRMSIANYGLDLIRRGDYRALLSSLADTLGMFTVKGEYVWLYNIMGRPAFVGPEGVLFYLGVVICLRRLRRPAYALQLIVIATMLVPSLLVEHSPSWTRSIGILPGLLVTAVLPIEWAWSRLGSRTTTKQSDSPFDLLCKRWALPLYATLVATLGVSIYARTAFDMFEVWMNHPGVYWMTLAFYSETADYVNRSPDSTPLDFNMDVYVPWRRTNLQRPIEREDVAVRWTINDAFVFPEHPDGLRVAFQIHAPPSPVLQETFFDDPDKPLHVGPRVDPTGQHILRVYGISRARLDAHLERAQDGPVFLPYTGTPVDSSVTAGDWLEFLGYEILNPEARPGEGLHVITYWRVIRPPPALAVFLHLLDRDGNLVAQFDGFDVVFDDLAPGDVVAQLHTLGLPPDLPDDEYRLQIGGYRREDLERLPLSVDAADNLLWLRTWRPMSGSGEGP